MTEEEKMHIWDRFDKIACIHFLPYMNERFSIMKSELDRIGILNSGRFFWEFTTPNPIYDYIRIPAAKNTGDKGITKATKVYTLQYYSLLKKLQHFGYEHVLIFEDDAAFLKDLDRLDAIVKAAPEDYDILNLDPFRRDGWLGAGKGYWGHYYDLEGNEVKKDWNEGMYLRYNSVVYQTSAMAFSKRGIDHILKSMDERFAPMDRYTWEHTEGLNTYCTTKGNNICVQNKSFHDKLTGDGYASTMEQIYGKDFESERYNISWQKPIDETNNESEEHT